MSADRAGSGEGLLVVEDLHKSYPTPAEPLEVLRGVSLRVEPGDSLAVLGPSGSGKTTLLNILGTLDAPTGGRVTLSGVDPFSLDPARLADFRSGNVGFVFQDHHLLPQLTARENVLVAALARGRVSADDERRADEVLRQVGLAHRAGHLPGELSGGERQRVVLARALLNRPALLLCDEPTGNLDGRTAETVGGLIADLAEENRAVVVVVTHSPELARRFRRRMRLLDGRLVE